MNKNDYGADHWSSDKVWFRRKKINERGKIIEALRKNEVYGGHESSEMTIGRIMAIMDIAPEEIPLDPE